MADDTAKTLSQHPAGDQEAGATRRVYATDEVMTFRVTDAQAADVSGCEAHHPLGTLPPGTLLCHTYCVERTLQPHESSRPGLYLCQGPEGRVIVKVYAANFPPKQELWQRLSFLHHPNILRVHQTLAEEDRYYEVQEYCAGGTLADRVPKPGSGLLPVPAEWLTNVLVPQMLAALNYLHEQEIVHRDIKPANIYLRDDGDELVLADFDISSVLEETRTSRDTQRTAGTWLYTAPEAFPRFVDDHASSKRGRVTRSCDYFSLGVTIIELLLGTTSLHQSQLPDLFDFYLQGGRVEIPQGIPGRLALLLRGLLIRNRRTRWGAPEIERWLANANTDGDLQRIQDDEYYELARASRPYRLGNRYAVDLPSLAEAMAAEPEIAKEDLITGDVLLNWIGNLDPTIARHIRRDRDRHYLTPELVLFSAIMRCDPTRPFVFGDGSEVITSAEWFTRAVAILKEFNLTPEEFCDDLLLCQLESWLQLKYEPEEELAARVGHIRTSPAKVRMEELAYLLQEERPYRLMRGKEAHTPREIAQLTYATPAEWKLGRPPCYDASFKRWLDGALCAWLRQRGLETLAKQCDEVQQRLPDEPEAAFETILRLLDPELPPVKVEIDISELPQPCTVEYRRQYIIRLPYHTRGSGVPFGAVRIDAPTPGIYLRDQVLRRRDGTLELVLDGYQDIPAARDFTATIVLDSGIAEVINNPVSIGYRMSYPFRLAAQRLALGAAIGAGLLGTPRLLMSLIGDAPAVDLHEFTARGLWSQIFAWKFPHYPLAAGLIFLLAAAYLGFRAWIRLLRDSEV